MVLIRGISAKDSFFYDGWGIPGEASDTIQLEGDANTAGIISVDYGQNSITVDMKVSWTQHQGLSLAYHGSSPDLGAHEYQRTSSGVDNLPHQSK